MTEYSNNLYSTTNIFHVIFLRGTVGCGKSTTSNEFKNQITRMGGECLLVGTDKYCSEGFDIGTACSKVKDDIIQFIENNKKDNLLQVIVVDTCGERSNINDVFGVDLDGWKEHELYVNYDHSSKDNIDNYLAWSLTNVLNRQKCITDCNYWLNPHDAGVRKCVCVHRKKALSVFGKWFSKPIISEYDNNLELIFNNICEMKNIYNDYINKRPVTEVVSAFIIENCIFL